MDGMTWEHFLQDIIQIYEISQQINDDWKVIQANEDVGGTYLMKRASILLPIGNDAILNRTDLIEADFKEEPSISLAMSTDIPFPLPQQELIMFEYHILYHLSYAVPYLCFNAHKSNGSFLTLTDAWNIFNDIDYRRANKNQLNMTNILTQMDHPILFKPFLTLHPCRTAELLESLRESQNKVLSFLSTYGPSVYLTFDLKYATLINVDPLLLANECLK